MEHAQMKNPSPRSATTDDCPSEQALGRWQDLIWSIDFCAGYEFAVMAGLAAPLMPLITNGSVAINFFGGDPGQRRKLLQLALSSWTDPAMLDDENLTNLSWTAGRTKLGFSYALHAERFSVLEIKSAVANSETRVAILCGEQALDEDMYLDDSVGGDRVYVLNLDVEKLGIEDDLGSRACTTADTLSALSESYAGDFLMQRLRERRPRIRDICNWLKIQAACEYEVDMINIVRGVLNDDPDEFYRTPALNLSYIPRILSVIRAIAVIAIKEDVLPEIQHYAVFSDIYWRWSRYQIKVKQAAMDENVS